MLMVNITLKLGLNLVVIPFLVISGLSSCSRIGLNDNRGRHPCGGVPPINSSSIQKLKYYVHFPYHGVKRRMFFFSFFILFFGSMLSVNLAK